MLGAPKSFLSLFIFALEVLGFLMALVTHGYTSLLLLPAIALTLAGSPYLSFLSSIVFSLMFVSTVDQHYIGLISTPIALLGTASSLVSSRGEEDARSIYLTLFVFLPLVFVSVKSAIPLIASLLTYITGAVEAYLRVGKSRLSVFPLNTTTYLNGYVDLAFEIVCPGSFVYKIQVDGRSYPLKAGRDVATDFIRIRAERLGPLKAVVKVHVADSRGLARVEHGPITVEYTVVPKFLELKRQSERVLRQYAKYLSMPSIYRATFKPVSSKIEKPQLGTWGTPQPKIAWKVPEHLLSSLAILLKSYIGEYIGVRDYRPGDSLKLIHWKKSSRRSDVLSLAVKEYSETSTNEAGYGGDFILLADLTATSSRDLDLLLQALYSYILSPARVNIFNRLHLYLVTPRGELYFIEGKTIDVLLALNALIVGEKLFALFDYDSWARSSAPLLGVTAEPINRIVECYRAYGLAILNELKDRGLDKRGVAILHSRALSFKYYVISDVLESAGLKLIIPGAERHS